MSKQVQKEVERAVNKGVSVIPLRIEEIDPTKSMEYFLSSTHWLDAITPPLELHLKYLADIILKFLGKSIDEKPADYMLKSANFTVLKTDEEDVLWEMACEKDDMESYLTYLEKSTAKVHEQKALNKLREISMKDFDRSAWAKAAEVNTTLSYLDYLNGDTVKAV